MILQIVDFFLINFDFEESKNKKEKKERKNVCLSLQRE